MADDERTEDVNPEEPAAQEPAAEEPAAEEPAAEEPAAEGPAAEEAPVEEPAPEEAPAEVPAPEEAPVEEPAPEEAPAEKPPAKPAPEGAKAKDLPPGAELEPISLEPDKPMSAEERARAEAEAEERERREAEATAEDGDEIVARSAPRVEIPADAAIQATGKRKNSIARVILKAGSGTFEVNRRPLDQYFPRAHLQTIARQALVTCGYEDNVDVIVRVHGGGISGQAGAIRHGIARALTEVDLELRPELKKRGFLTRDARIKERRKAGLKKARKKPQFSKR